MRQNEKRADNKTRGQIIRQICAMEWDKERRCRHCEWRRDGENICLLPVCMQEKEKREKL